MSTSEGLTLAASNAESNARSPSSSAVSTKISFASVKPLSWLYCDNGNEMRRFSTPALAPNRSNCGPPKLVRPDSASRWPTRCGGNSIATAATDADGVVLAFPPCTPGVTGPICHRIQVVSRGWAALLVIQFLESTYSTLDSRLRARVGRRGGRNASITVPKYAQPARTPQVAGCRPARWRAEPASARWSARARG